MLKSILLVSTLLALVGCSGGEFYSADESFAPTAGTAGTSGSEAGQTSDAGEPSTGGTDGLGAQGGTGGDQAGSASQGGSTGGTEGLGGDGPTPMGGSAGTGGTTQVPDPICTPDAGRCSNLNFEVCSKDGLKWVKQETCGQVCTATGCTGDCKPGSSKCDGLDSLSCNESGKWVKTSTCPFTCSGAGECKGSCVPGQKFCDGKTPQTCDETGELVNGEACQNLCSAGTCTGACTPGVKQCNGKISQECLANGTWKDTTCSYVCGGAGVCGGECVPGEKKCSVDTISIQTCNPQGKWEIEGSCPFICSNGACGGICKPNQNCNDDGNECTQEVCSPDGLSCNHPIKANGTTCGSQTNNECNKPDTCQAGVCKSNYSPTTTTCQADTNACTVDACNGTGTCAHTAGNAGSICRASSCTNGQVLSEGKCDGVSTSCSAATKNDCFGPCDSQSLMCELGQPQKVADAYTMLATDNDALYLYASVRNDSGTAQVLRIRKSDGTQTVLYQDNSGDLWIYAIILAGNHLYLGETTKVTRIDTATANQTPTFIQTVSTFGFAKNSSRVYWSDASKQACDCASPPTHHVYSTPINGDGTVTAFGLNFGSEDLSPDIEVSETDLYVWEMTNHSAGLYHPSLTRYNLTNPAGNAAGLIAGSFNNGTVQTTSGLTQMPGLTKNGTHIFANTESGIGTTVFSVKMSNDVLTLLATDNQAAASSNFVADAQSVYLSNEKVAVTGGSFSYTSAHSIAGPSTLTLDGTFLYFGSYGYYTAPPYTFNVDVPLRSLFKTAK